MMKNPNVIMAAVLAALVLAEVLFAHNHHPHFWWDKIPGLYAILGLGSCLVVVIVSKQLGKLGLQRPERPEDNE